MALVNPLKEHGFNACFPNEKCNLKEIDIMKYLDGHKSWNAVLEGTLDSVMWRRKMT